MGWIREQRARPWTIFGLAALAVALGGAAFAAIPDSGGTIRACYHKSSGNLRVVESAGDCRNNENPIEWNQQGPPGPPGPPGQPVAFDEAVSEVSTTSDSYIDLGRPSVTVNVPPSGLIAVLARAELRGAPGCQFVALHESTDFDPPQSLIFSCANQSYLKKWSSPAGGFGGDGSAIGTGTKGQVTWTVLEATPGLHTYSLRYRTDPARPDEAFFRNRKLWIKAGG